MSETATPPSPPAATITDQIVAQAKDLPQLISMANTFNPALAASLTAKPLIASKSPWGVLVCAGVGLIASRYGLACMGAATANCWSPDTVNLIGGLATMAGAFVGSFIMRYVTRSPIGGVFSVPTQGSST